jgi:hypothetical protein
METFNSSSWKEELKVCINGEVTNKSRNQNQTALLEGNTLRGEDVTNIKRHKHAGVTLVENRPIRQGPPRTSHNPSETPKKCGIPLHSIMTVNNLEPNQTILHNTKYKQILNSSR